ncbi:MAG: alkaline phosphatase [Opitutaceae bacterium]
MNTKNTLQLIAAATAAFVVPCAVLDAAPEVLRLTPPSALFSYGIPDEPITSRFLPGQRFDLQATIAPDEGETIKSVRFYLDGREVSGPVTLTPATASGLPTNTVSASLRATSVKKPGIHKLTVVAKQSDNATGKGTGNFEVVELQGKGGKAKNIIFMIGDGMGIAHRTAARIMLNGVTQGKADAQLAMDMFPQVALINTHSLNSIVTDSAPGAACYSTGNKSNNNQQGVFPDDTVDAFDNPRVENIGEYLKRIRGASLGIVTTSDVFDATPGAFGSHTSNRGAGTGICDQYLDERGISGLSVLMGGGRKWFLPKGEIGSARSNSNDYVLPTDVANAWGVPTGELNESRDLLGDFQSAGFKYAANRSDLMAIPGNTKKLLGLFAYSNMNVALDKINGQRGVEDGLGGSTVVQDYGFPDQPMLDEMTRAALKVLSKNRNGFVLMVEAASIDKQAHNMDTERWILDTIEFDRAIDVARRFALRNEDTLVIITADHECAGVNIIGGSRTTQAGLEEAASDGSLTALRNNLVGTYDAAGFPRYTIAADGYPETTDVDYRMLIGYAANADRYEDWITNPQPLRDSQQPLNGSAPLNLYPSGPMNRDGFLVTGQVGGSTAVHTASDIPLSALGCGAERFHGVMDNTTVFFKAMAAALEGCDEGKDWKKDHDKGKDWDWDSRDHH